MNNKIEDSDLSDEALEKGEMIDNEEETLLSMLPIELQNRWREATPEELTRVVTERKEILDRWLKRQEQVRAERSGGEMHV